MDICPWESNLSILILAIVERDSRMCVLKHEGS